MTEIQIRLGEIQPAGIFRRFLKSRPFTAPLSALHNTYCISGAQCRDAVNSLALDVVRQATASSISVIVLDRHNDTAVDAAGLFDTLGNAFPQMRILSRVSQLNMLAEHPAGGKGLSAGQIAYIRGGAATARDENDHPLALRIMTDAAAQMLLHAGRAVTDTGSAADDHGVAPRTLLLLTGGGALDLAPAVSGQLRAAGYVFLHLRSRGDVDAGNAEQTDAASVIDFGDLVTSAPEIRHRASVTGRLADAAGRRSVSLDITISRQPQSAVTMPRGAGAAPDVREDTRRSDTEAGATKAGETPVLRAGSLSTAGKRSAGGRGERTAHGGNAARSRKDTLVAESTHHRVLPGVEATAGTASARAPGKPEGQRQGTAKHRKSNPHRKSAAGRT